MNLDAEKYLWDRISGGGAHRFPRDVIQEMLNAGMIHSPKQAWRTLEKWSNAGAYSYGVVLDLGWRLRDEFPRQHELPGAKE